MDEWLLNQDSFTIYLALFGLLLGGAIGLPIPEDIPLLLAGIVLHHGITDPRILFPVCYIGIILGDLTIFAIGRYVGLPLFRKKWMRARISTQRVVVIKRNLERRSLPMIFVARHLFYLRTVTFLTCGAFKMSLRRFIVADALAALISVPMMIGLGYFFSENYSHIIGYVGRAKSLSLTLAVLLVGGYLIFRYQKRRKLVVEKISSEVQLEKESPLGDKGIG